MTKLSTTTGTQCHFSAFVHKYFLLDKANIKEQIIRCVFLGTLQHVIAAF